MLKKIIYKYKPIFSIGIILTILGLVLTVSINISDKFIDYKNTINIISNDMDEIYRLNEGAIIEDKKMDEINCTISIFSTNAYPVSEVSLMSKTLPPNLQKNISIIYINLNLNKEFAKCLVSKQECFGNYKISNDTLIKMCEKSRNNRKYMQKNIYFVMEDLKKAKSKSFIDFTIQTILEYHYI